MMTIDEVKAFCVLRGDEVKDAPNPQVQGKGGRWLQIKAKNRIFTIVYYRNPENDKQTFLTGRVSTQSELGTRSEELWNMENLEKLL